MILSDDEKAGIIKNLNAIEEQCTKAGWSLDRRWIIEQLARETRLMLESPLARPEPRN